MNSSTRRLSPATSKASRTRRWLSALQVRTPSPSTTPVLDQEQDRVRGFDASLLPAGAGAQGEGAAGVRSCSSLACVLMPLFRRGRRREAPRAGSGARLRPGLKLQEGWPWPGGAGSWTAVFRGWWPRPASRPRSGSQTAGRGTMAPEGGGSGRGSAWWPRSHSAPCSAARSIRRFLLFGRTTSAVGRAWGGMRPVHGVDGPQPIGFTPRGKLREDKGGSGKSKGLISTMSQQGRRVSR